DRVRAELLDGATEGDARWLLAQLLEYHRREERPQWWEFFYHCELDEEELLEDGDTIGALESVGDPVPVKQSLEYTLAFAGEEHNMAPSAVARKRRRGYHGRVDDKHGSLTLRRGVASAKEPLPRALIPPGPPKTTVQRDAVLRFAKDPQAFPALVDILE